MGLFGGDEVRGNPIRQRLQRSGSGGREFKSPLFPLMN